MICYTDFRGWACANVPLNIARKETLKIVVVPHGAKVMGVTQYSPELGADPPMTMEGKAKVLGLVPVLKTLGPYDAAYCSLMDRACGTMCTIVKHLGIRRVICIDELGQYSNLDGETIIFYPGHENDSIPIWQQQVGEALRRIYLEVAKNGLADGPVGLGGSAYEKKVLVFTHRPILAALVAAASHITDPAEIQKILDAKELVGKGLRVFNYNGQNLSLVV